MSNSRKSAYLCLLYLLGISSVNAIQSKVASLACKEYCLGDDGRSIYDFPINEVLHGTRIDWNDFKGRVVLIVNVASFCSSTPQYLQLNALQSQYNVSDFRILGVPCNQFAYHEPGLNGTEILNSLKYVRPGDGFEPMFTLTERTDVNGPDQNPLYKYLKSRCPSPRKSFATKQRLMYDGFYESDIRWNFEKFLIDKSGRPVIRYEEAFQPQDIEVDVDDLIRSIRTYENYLYIERGNNTFIPAFM